jgi:hypothetical protein
MKKLIKSVALAVYGELKRDGMRNGFTRIALFALLTFGGFVGLGTNQSSASTYLYTFTSPLYGSGYIDFTVNNTGLVTSASGQFTSTIDPATYSGPITIDTTVSGATLGAYTFNFTNILSLTQPYFPAYPSAGLGLIKIAGYGYEFNSYNGSDVMVGPPSFNAGINISSESLTATTAAPLPSTWLMLLSGFVGLGFFAYRGSKKNVVAIAA